MRFVTYLRVSTDDQADSRAGLRAQVDACTIHAHRAGGEIVGPFADEGVSGALPIDKRPGLMAALAEIGKGDVLLIAKRDRLGRDIMVLATIEAMIRAKGARVVSAAGEGTGSDDPGDALLRMLIDAFAVYERLVIKARTSAALGAKRRRGERTGRIPFGFDLVDDGRRSKEGRPIGLVPNPAEQSVIAEIRALADGGMLPAEIARDLQRRAVPSKTGARWSNMAVRRILARPEHAKAELGIAS